MYESRQTADVEISISAVLLWGRDPVERAKRAKQTTTRYAGARQMLYKENHLSVIMRLFKPEYNERKGDFNG